MTFRSMLLAACLLALPFAAPATAASPVQRVDSFHAALLDAMQNAFMEDTTERFDRLAPTINDMFDFPKMMRIVSGKHWKNFDDAAKKNVTEAFARLSVATYASNFNGYGGEKFETKGLRDGPKKSKLVDTQVVGKDGGRIDISYVMQQADGVWKVVNVILDKGISELAVRRSEYAGLLDKGGADLLVKTLNDKAESLLSAP